MFRTADHARHPILSSFAGKGEHVWSYVNLTHETVWFCASYIVHKSDTCAWPETLLLSKVEQLTDLYRNFKGLIEVTRLVVVTPPRINKTSDWHMDPLREIWCGRSPRYDENVFVYRLDDGCEYIDAPYPLEYTDLLEPQCIVSVIQRS